MSVYQTKRKPSFHHDVNYYGEKGEQHFLQLLEEEKDCSVKDVRKDKKWQSEDVDFLVEKNGTERRIEVKVDCVGITTGNIPYEVVSHGKDGWSVKTTADFVYFILCEDQPDGLYAQRAYWIDMAKWRVMVANNQFFKENKIINENIVDYLFKIDKMKDCGAIVKTNIIEQYI